MAKFIVSLMPPTEPRFVDAFAGRGAISWAVMTLLKYRRHWINAVGTLGASQQRLMHIIEYVFPRRFQRCNSIRLLLPYRHRMGFFHRRPKIPQYRKDDAATARVLEAINEPYRSALMSMYRGEPQRGADGQLHPIDDNTLIAPLQGIEMYDLYREWKPKASLEIGMAYGYSSLFFAAAIAKNGFGQHTAIDPFEHSHWHGIGLERLRAVGAEVKFREERDIHAATHLAGRTFDLIYIDGNHRFDDVVDFTLFAPLTSRHILFDDMWLPSVRAVVSFIHANRGDFVEVASGHGNLAIFERVADDTRPWDHFKKFNT
jgi:predicted O-methyltransferase YrrM